MLVWSWNGGEPREAFSFGCAEVFMRHPTVVIQGVQEADAARGLTLDRELVTLIGLV